MVVPSLRCCMDFLWLWKVGATFQLLCAGFSLQRFSRCRVWAPERSGISGCSTWAHCLQLRGPGHRLSSCDAWAYMLHSTWDHPGPGIEPVSLALTGRFFTTEPPVKPLILNLLIHWWSIHFNGSCFWLLCIYRSLKNLFTPLFHFFNIVEIFLQYLGYLKPR